MAGGKRVMTTMNHKESRAAGKGKAAANRQVAQRQMVGRVGKKIQKMALSRSLADDTAAHYLAACLAPFSTEANGARVPTPFCVPTRTTRLVVPYTLTLSASSKASFVATANPTVGILCPPAVNLAGPVSGINVVPQGGQAGNPLAQVNPAISDTQLGGVYYCYRTVAWGLRVKCDANFTGVSGKMFAAVVPAGSMVPSIVPNTGTTQASWWNAVGVPWDTTSTNVSKTILSLPVSEEVALTEVLEKGSYEFLAPKTGPRHADFLHLGDGGALPDLANFNTGTGAGAYYTSADTVAVAGHSLIAIALEGASASQTITVEVIYHLEGQPVPAASTYIADDSLMPAFGTTTQLEAANAAVAASPAIRGCFAGADGLKAALRDVGRATAHSAIRGAATAVLGLLA